MISFKQAYKIARKEITDSWKIIRILDAPEFWLFCDERSEIMPIGYNPIAVNKKDGRVWGVFPPAMTDEQLEALENAKEVEVPL